MGAVKSIRALNVGHVLCGCEAAQSGQQGDHRKRERQDTWNIHGFRGAVTLAPPNPTPPPASTSPGTFPPIHLGFFAQQGTTGG